MIARWLTILLSFALPAGLTLPVNAGAADPPRMTDLIPQKSIGAIFFRNINEVRRNGDQLFNAVGWPFGPTQLLAFVGQELKVNGLVDGERPCGVAWFEPENDEPAFGFRLPPAAAVFGIRDLNALATRLGTTADELRAGKTIRVKGQELYPQRFFRFADDYLWIVTDERLFVDVTNGMPLTFAIAKSRRERMQNSDILLSFRPTAKVADRDQMLKNGQRWIDERPELGVEEQAALHELFAVFESMSNVVLGVRIHKDGIEADADVYFDFRKREAVHAVLRRFNPTGATSSLSGLPDGRVLFSHALQADGKATLPALNALLPELTLTQNWRSVGGLQILSDAQQLKLLGLFGEVWQRTNGYRLAAYENADPQQHGLLGLVAVLETDEPAQVIAEIRDLAEFLDGTRLFVTHDPTESGSIGQKSATLSSDGEARVRSLVKQLGDEDFAVRQSATIRLMLIGEPARSFVEPLTKPEDGDSAEITEVSRHARRVLALLDAAKKQASLPNATPQLLNSSELRFHYSVESVVDSGRQIHSIDIEHSGDSPQHKELKQQMRKLFGSDWNRLRLVPFEDRILVLIGSDPAFLDRSIVSVAENSQAVQAATAAGLFGPPLNSACGAEFHVSLSHIREIFSRRYQSPDAEADRASPPEQATQPAGPADDALPLNNVSSTGAAQSPPGNPVRPAGSFSSLSFTIQEDYLSIEWRVPVDEIRALNASN